MNILALDPGETTGFVIASVKPNEDDSFMNVHVQHFGVWKGIKNFHKHNCLFTPHDVHRFCIFCPVEVVVCEDYRIYPGTAVTHTNSQVYTAREIGRIEYVAYCHGLQKSAGSFVFQTASMAKQQWSNKRMGTYTEGWQWREWSHSLHVLDAIRHLLTYVERTFKHRLLITSPPPIVEDITPQEK